MCVKIVPILSPAVQKDVPQSTSSSTAAQVTSGSSSSYMSGDLQIPTGSADVAADIAKYTNKVIWPILLHVIGVTAVLPSFFQD